ncbi:MAG TPA: endonuclease/exonuclease/phosphatase family protein, partial [Chthoniobacteraceae bacterium]|nr:endonuclease/exonuclease/phosphatase family protein [Chthoniobacteraceae bacterium]
MCRIPSAFAVLAWIFVACIGRADDQLRTVRVLTYNIHHGEGTDGNFDLDRIARVIRAASPDLVALQEVDQKTKRSGGIDQLQKLAELTGLHPAYGRAMDYQGGAYGVAMLSRWPLKESRTHSLPSDPGVEPRVVLSAELTIGETGSNVHFLVTHVDHRADPTQRTMQLAKLREIFPAKPDQGLSI